MAIPIDAGKKARRPIEAINRAFSPSAEEIANAQRILAAFRAEEAGGSAAFTLDGAFIDYAIIARAQRLLDAAARIDVGRSRKTP